MKRLYVIIFCCYLIFVIGNIRNFSKNSLPQRDETVYVSESYEQIEDIETEVPETKRAVENNHTAEVDKGGSTENNTYRNDISQAISQAPVVAGDTSRPLGKDQLHTYRYSYDLGSSRTLKGNIAVYCFFIDDSESSWSGEACDKFISEQITPALDFLKTEAGKWGVEVDFSIIAYCDETADFSLKYNGTVNTDLNDVEVNKDIADQIAKNMGYSDASAFTVAEDAKKIYDDSAFLTFVNKSGRSYTINLYNEGSEYCLDDAVTERCVIFSEGAENLPKTACSSTVAHEILHLFGAEDYYGDIRRPIANRYYFFDIMLLNSRNLRRLNVGDMTAFCVGWTDEVPELCLDETWVSGRFEEL